MKDLAVLIPFKSSGQKSRLSGVLRKDERNKLSKAMLEDVLEVLSDSGLSGQTHVITSDKSTLDLVSRFGANWIAESSDEGVNSAVRLGVRQLKSTMWYMVVPSDLPLLRPLDISTAMSFLEEGFGAVVSPSREFNGTNLLCFRRSSPIGLSYDKNSFWNHIRSAAAKRIRLSILSARGFMFDIDSPRDLSDLKGLRINNRTVDFAKALRFGATPRKL